MVMAVPNSPWTRRSLLKTVPALGASALFPRLLSAAVPEPTPAAPKPFSRFTDVAQSAGLTATMCYGPPKR